MTQMRGSILLSRCDPNQEKIANLLHRYIDLAIGTIKQNGELPTDWFEFLTTWEAGAECDANADRLKFDEGDPNIPQYQTIKVECPTGGRPLVDLLMEQGDVLLYPTPKTEKQFNEIVKKLATAIAIMSFLHGGIEFWGKRFESKFDA